MLGFWTQITSIWELSVCQKAVMPEKLETTFGILHTVLIVTPQGRHCGAGKGAKESKQNDQRAGTPSAEVGRFSLEKRQLRMQT